MRVEALREELVEDLTVSAARTTAVTDVEQETACIPVPGSTVPPWRDRGSAQGQASGRARVGLLPVTSGIDAQ